MQEGFGRQFVSDVAIVDTAREVNPDRGIVPVEDGRERARLRQ
jgi:hypothetical protein